MIDILKARLRQGHRTSKYPGAEPVMPERFRGLPVLHPEKCESGCRACADVCPTGAILPGPPLRLDLGACVFCPACAEACPTGAVAFSTDYQLAARKRSDLLLGEEGLRKVGALDEKMRKLFGRSLKLRQVSAGGCNACEADINVLSTIVFDLGQFGIQVVASPRHADGILVTGPVTENMRTALLDTYAAVPDPKLVIALGACAISGGLFAESPEQHRGVETFLPVDLYIPGCPPHPMTILDGLLRMLGRIDKK